MTVGSLFSGIGGFDLGFERAGYEIKWQVEIDDYANHVLEKHWPAVRRYRDVRQAHGVMAHAEHLRELQPQGCERDERGWISHGSDARTDCAGCLEPVDVICGGFPCQPHSLAGRRGGSADERDLWPEFARLIRELQPRWVVAENVPGLLSSDAGRFFGAVLGDLAALGYDAEWDCISAADMGAPHLRERIWIVAYPAEREGGERYDVDRERRRTREAEQVGLGSGAVADDSEQRRGSRREGRSDSGGAWEREQPLSAVAHTDEPRLERRHSGIVRECAGQQPTGTSGASLADANGGDEHGRRGDVQVGRIWGTRKAEESLHAFGNEWSPEPDVGRVAHGVPARVDRLRGLGNAIVPQIAEWIAERIKEAEGVTR